MWLFHVFTSSQSETTTLNKAEFEFLTIAAEVSWLQQ